MLIVNGRSYEVATTYDGFQHYAEATYDDWRLVGQGRTMELAVEALRLEIEETDHFTKRGGEPHKPR